LRRSTRGLVLISKTVSIVSATLRWAIATYGHFTGYGKRNAFPAYPGERRLTL
jgi:hypothetical protein